MALVASCFMPQSHVGQPEETPSVTHQLSSKSLLALKGGCSNDEEKDKENTPHVIKPDNLAAENTSTKSEVEIKKRRSSFRSLFGGNKNDCDGFEEDKGKLNTADSDTKERRPSLRGLFGLDKDLPSNDDKSKEQRRPSLRGLFGFNTTEKDDQSPSTEEGNVKKRRPSLKDLFRSNSKRKLDVDETGTQADETLCLEEPMTPQSYLAYQLDARGYDTNQTKATETALHKKPTPYQLASYGPEVIKLVEQKAEAELEAILEIGLSPNACNGNGETLVHMACRLGQHQLVKLFLRHGFVAQVCDVRGRTLLHATCWGARPSFQTFSLLMATDPSLLFLADAHGKCPLEYVRSDHHVFWYEYIDRIVDEFWPHLNEAQAKPDLGQPFSRSIADPKDALPLPLLKLLAAGKISRDDVVLHLLEQECGSSSSDDDSDYTESDEEDSSSSSYFSDEDDDMP